MWENINVSPCCVKLDCAPSLLLFLLRPSSGSLLHGLRTQREMAVMSTKETSPLQLFVSTHTQTPCIQQGHSRAVCLCVSVQWKEGFALPLIPLSLSGVALNVLPPMQYSHTSLNLSCSTPSPTERTNTNSFLLFSTQTPTLVPLLTSVHLCRFPPSSQQLTHSCHLFCLLHTALLCSTVSESSEFHKSKQVYK